MHILLSKYSLNAALFEKNVFTLGVRGKGKLLRHQWQLAYRGLAGTGWFLAYPLLT